MERNTSIPSDLHRLHSRVSATVTSGAHCQWQAAQAVTARRRLPIAVPAAARRARSETDRPPFQVGKYYDSEESNLKANSSSIEELKIFGDCPQFRHCYFGTHICVVGETNSKNSTKFILAFCFIQASLNESVVFVSYNCNTHILFCRKQTGKSLNVRHFQKCYGI